LELSATGSVLVFMPSGFLRRLLIACAAFLITALVWAQQPAAPTADAIMARVAANQDRAESERAHFVYTQHVRAISRKGKIIRCEEVTDSRVTPTDGGSQQELLKVDGRLLVKGKYVTYSKLPNTKDKGVDTHSDHSDEDVHAAVKSEDDNDQMDQDLVENLRHNLLDTKSKDGVAAGLFPLSSKAAGHYNYRLLGREPRNGRDCFHIAFTPKDDVYDWKGDVWVDAAAYEPVVVRTALYKNIPLAVRILLGTSVPGLGFTVTYAPQPSDKPDARWFPSTFGTEFKVHVFFFLNREIIIDAQNRDFEKTHTSSTIVGEPNFAPQQ
jgi:hypothetical protein